MFLKDLKLINFKNYAEANISFSEKINCFTGLNGAGKTNILDAVYYMSFTKSYFNHTDSLHVKKGDEFFLVQGNYERSEKNESISCGYKKSTGKSFKRNDKKYKKFSEHIGLLPLIIVSPDDNKLIIGSGEERRKYIDSVISQYDRSYLNELIKYQRLLSQRNKFLKSDSLASRSAKDTIEIYNMQLHNSGTIIHRKRQEFVKNLQPLFEKYYNTISEEKESIALKYKSQLNQNELLSLLNNNFEKDRALQYTYYGIHRDDLKLTIDDFKLSKAGSQGQQKTFLIALKFAQYEFIKQLSRLNPILLLDDIFDKFDADRIEKIVELIREDNFGQIFITDTNPERISRVLHKTKTEYKLFEVANNTITEERTKP
ncbi:MAG: DNA replication and repair protein RecF [Bacteroidota bacterium]|nr:DNA replication and repair protein RecF [Bacteroidota bacterium]